MKMLFRSLGGTVFWNMFQWFFTAEKDCGFKVFPIFGLEAYKHGYTKHYHINKIN